jgi:MFS family permease
MNQDLGFTQSIFGAGAGILFIGYLLFEVPSNLALQHFGARVWIVRIMVSWGLVAMAMAVVSGPASFYAMRFLLGVAEAGFFPGIILYLTYWFPAHERARIVSLFMAAVPLATLIGSPVSGALLELHGLGGLKVGTGCSSSKDYRQCCSALPRSNCSLTGRQRHLGSARMKSMRSKPSSRQKPRRRVTRAITRSAML